jgi:hypothetical protein
MAALAQLRGLAVQPPAAGAPGFGEPPPVMAETPSAPAGGRGGRPAADTEQISLRPPKAWLALLRRKAAEASLAEGRTVTPQMIILRMIEAEVMRELEARADG